jgi:hypothetical protein
MSYSRVDSTVVYVGQSLVDTCSRVDSIVCVWSKLDVNPWLT